MKPQYWALLILLAWLALIWNFDLLRSDVFGLSEGGALNLLLGWSASAQIQSPITHIGTFDFRLLPDYLLGLYWPGSLNAARVLSLLYYFLALVGLYFWSLKQSGEESAKMASGLMLILPVCISLANNLDVGPLLLLMFVCADLLDRRYRNAPHVISGWYFLQMITAAACLSLHPIGAVYPLLMAWRWFQLRRGEPQKSNAMFIGLLIAAVFVATMQIGWIDVSFASSPIQVLDDAISGFNPLDTEHGMVLGWIAALLLLAVLYLDRKTLFSTDLMSGLLAAGCIVGAFFADLNWALIVIATIFYRGIPWLLTYNSRVGKQSFAAQRGISFALLLLISFVFMQFDRSIAVANNSEVLSAQDELIKTLSDSVDKDAPFFAASQWPARTMMVCKRDVFGLPPAQESGAALLKIMRGVTHVIFDPNQVQNQHLSKNLSEINDKIKTVAIQEGGVIIAVRNPDVSRLPQTQEKKKAPVSNPASDLPTQK